MGNKNSKKNLSFNNNKLDIQVIGFYIQDAKILIRDEHKHLIKYEHKNNHTDQYGKITILIPISNDIIYLKASHGIDTFTKTKVNNFKTIVTTHTTTPIVMNILTTILVESLETNSIEEFIQNKFILESKLNIPKVDYDFVNNRENKSIIKTFVMIQNLLSLCNVITLDNKLKFFKFLLIQPNTTIQINKNFINDYIEYICNPNLHYNIKAFLKNIIINITSSIYNSNELIEDKLFFNKLAAITKITHQILYAFEEHSYTNINIIIKNLEKYIHNEMIKLSNNIKFECINNL